MPTYKLYYFDVPARGELPRLLFAAAGQAFEDIRITSKTWPEFKPKMPFGQVPVLDVDGTMIAQEYAISKFLSKEFGFCSGSVLDEAREDMYVFVSEDIYVQVEEIFHNFQNAEKRMELTKKWTEQTGPRILARLNDHLAASTSGYYVGDKITYADIAMFSNLGVMQHVLPTESVTLLAAYPNVKRNLDLVRSHKNIDAYVTKRDAATK